MAKPSCGSSSQPRGGSRYKLLSQGKCAEHARITVKGRRDDIGVDLLNHRGQIKVSIQERLDTNSDASHEVLLLHDAAQHDPLGGKRIDAAYQSRGDIIGLEIPAWVVGAQCFGWLPPPFREVRISVGSTRQKRQDFTLLPVAVPAAIEHQRAQRG